METPQHARPRWRDETPPWWYRPVSIFVVLFFVWQMLPSLPGLGSLTPDLPTLVETEVTTEIGQPAVTIRQVEPISLGCYAYVKAGITLHAVERHRAELFGLGGTYRSDHAHLRGSTDVDVCVDTDNTTIVGDVVTVAPQDIVVRRPRVDHSDFAIQTSVGWVGDITHAVPGVSDNVGPLVDHALARAQHAMGSGRCIAETWDAVQAAITDAYTSTYPHLTLELPNFPTFEDLTTESAPELPDGVHVSTDVTCLVSPTPERTQS